MKYKVSILVVFCLLITIFCFSQEKTKKELKAAKELQKQKETEALVDAGDFVFDAEYVMPQSGRMIYLDYNRHYLALSPEIVKCDLPFFGRAFYVPYGGDGGIKFEGKPENIKVEKNNKSYSIKATVKGKDDVYNLFFAVFYDGGTTLSINSNNRVPISYTGHIRAPEPKKD